MKNIAIFGSHAGHNAGDDAILENILKDVSELIPDVRFFILVGRPQLYRKHFTDYNITWLPLGRRYLSIKFFGWQPFYALCKCEMIFLTQNMFFDYKMSDRSFNVLRDWSFQIRLAKKLAKKIVGYNIGYGPIRTDKGRRLAKEILSCADFISFREHEGERELKETLKIDWVETFLSADPAINNQSLKTKEVVDFCESTGFRSDLPYVCLNANEYIGDKSITNSDVTKHDYENAFVEIGKKLVEEGKTILVIATCFGDITLTKKIASRIGNSAFVITNKNFSHKEITWFLEESELLIGTRMHACVMSAAVNTPIISINYVPKVRHFMGLLGLSEYSFEPSDFNCEKVFPMVTKALNSNPIDSKRLQELKALAKVPARKVKELF